MEFGFACPASGLSLAIFLRLIADLFPEYAEKCPPVINETLKKLCITVCKDAKLQHDDSFVIKGNNQQQLIRLLSDEQLKNLMHDQSRISLEIRDDEGWFGADFAEGVDELYFCRVGVMRDVAELKALFELVSHTLTRLVQIDSAYENDPNVDLKV